VKVINLQQRLRRTQPVTPCKPSCY
jgi:hypothetical protein